MYFSTPENRNCAFVTQASGYRDRDQISKFEHNLNSFGHQTWDLTRVPEVTYMYSLCTQGAKIGLILVLGISGMLANLQNFHTWG